MQIDSRSRKWQLTINNPLDKGIDHAAIIKGLRTLKSVTYFCMSDEIGGETHTYHTHVFVYANNAIRFSTLKNLFETAHFEMCKGTCEDNRHYVFKTGKWLNSEKECTNLSDTHYEEGDLPIERQGKRNDLDDLYDMVREGLSDFQILQDSPKYMTMLDDINAVRQTIAAEKYNNCIRQIQVKYIYGVQGTGKTRHVYDAHGFTDVYRVVDYKHPFDTYNGQRVLCLDEFRSSLNFSFLLQLLDIYPLELPARYRNRVACFDTVYIISNIPLAAQYPNVQEQEPISWKAFKRRINGGVYYMNANGVLLPEKDYVQEKIEMNPFEEVAANGK